MLFGGNITYIMNVDIPGGNMTIEVPQAQGSVVEVALNGVRKGDIIFSPSQAELRSCTRGKS